MASLSTGSLASVSGRSIPKGLILVPNSSHMDLLSNSQFLNVRSVVLPALLSISQYPNASFRTKECLCDFVWVMGKF